MAPGNSKGFIFEFFLNRKRNKCWLAAYRCDLFTYQYIGRNFVGYVINTAGLENVVSWWYFYKLLVGFNQKILQKSV